MPSRETLEAPLSEWFCLLLYTWAVAEGGRMWMKSVRWTADSGGANKQLKWGNGVKARDERSLIAEKGSVPGRRGSPVP